MSSAAGRLGAASNADSPAAPARRLVFAGLPLVMLLAALAAAP